MKNIDKFAKFICSLITFWRFYRDYGYDGLDMEYIVKNYQEVLQNRTMAMSKPNYPATHVICRLDEWYTDRFYRGIHEKEETEKEDSSPCNRKQ